MGKDKIKKTYLRFVTDEKGGVNIKFGPKKYAGNVEEFYKLLMTGNILAIQFLSSTVIKDEERESLFHRVGDTYNAILLDSFPDVHKKILEEDSIIAKADEATEEGKQILSDEEELEFQKKKAELKDNLAEDFEEVVPVNIKTETILKEQLLLQYGLTVEELKDVELLLKKVEDGSYLNKKDRELLIVFATVGAQELIQEFKFLM